MEMNKTNNIENLTKSSEQKNYSIPDDATELWKQYQKQRNKKKLSKIILFSFVILILVILVIVGLYIILSTTDPLQSI